MITIRAYQRKRDIPADDLDAIEGRVDETAGAANVAGLFQESLVQLELTAKTRDEALTELVGLLGSRDLAGDPEAVLRQLKEREQQMSTVIGHGVAVPHVISEQVLEPVILLGRSKRGISFSSSIFRRPVHLVFVILVPANRKGRYLGILSSLVKLLRHRKVIDGLLAAKSPLKAVSVLKKHEALIRLHGELGL